MTEHATLYLKPKYEELIRAGVSQKFGNEDISIESDPIDEELLRVKYSIIRLCFIVPEVSVAHSILREICLELRLIKNRDYSFRKISFVRFTGLEIKERRSQDALLLSKIGDEGLTEDDIKSAGYSLKKKDKERRDLNYPGRNLLRTYNILSENFGISTFEKKLLQFILLSEDWKLSVGNIQQYYGRSVPTIIRIEPHIFQDMQDILRHALQQKTP